MKKPLDEQTMLEVLELAKEASQKARETSELATAIAKKYQKRMREKPVAPQQPLPQD